VPPPRVHRGSSPKFHATRDTLHSGPAFDVVEQFGRSGSLPTVTARGEGVVVGARPA